MGLYLMMMMIRWCIRLRFLPSYLYANILNLVMKWFPYRPCSGSIVGTLIILLGCIENGGQC
jgi:hypothetical protein